MDRLRAEKISTRDTYSEVLRRTFKKLDSKHDIKDEDEHIRLVSKEDVKR